MTFANPVSFRGDRLLHLIRQGTPGKQLSLLISYLNRLFLYRPDFFSP